MTSPRKPAPAPDAATSAASPPDAEAMRRSIVMRLMRAHCERLGGCTRACRRQRRCVAADRVEHTRRAPARRA